MTLSLAPYTAVLLASYGGPNEPDDVLPFMRNATAGKGIPDERLLEVSQHYMMFGGRSPINELNDALITALRDELTRRGIEVPVVIGNRNWHPFHKETVGELADAGHTRVLGLPTSAYHSYSSCRQYSEDFEKAMDDVDRRVVIDKVAPFAETEGFIRANADAAKDAVASLRAKLGEAKTRVLFVTHSIPDAMNEASGDGTPGSTYREQHLRVATAVADIVEEETGEALDWELTYCSRSGPPHVPWLEPDVSDRIAELPADGVDGAVLVPIGFLSDHMEVVYDLDTEAKAAAADAEIGFERAATAGTHHAFVSMLVDRLLERAAVARGDADESTERAYLDATPCCYARPVAVAAH